MSTLRIVREDGSIREFEPDSQNVTIELDDGTLFEPAIVDRLEYDHSGEISKTKYETCTRTETRRESDDPPEVVMEGIVTEGQLADLKELKAQRNPTIVCEITSGQFAVERVVVEQNNDIVEYIPNGGEPQLAFPFQLQIEKTPRTVRSHPPEETEPLFESYEEYRQWSDGELAVEDLKD